MCENSPQPGEHQGCVDRAGGLSFVAESANVFAFGCCCVPGFATGNGCADWDSERRTLPYQLPATILGAETQIVAVDVAVTRLREIEPTVVQFLEAVTGAAASDRMAPTTTEPTPTLDIPFSPAMILFGVGLAGLLLLGRRRRSTGPGLTD